MDVGDVLLISGIPGSGKTRYAKWLEGHGWRVESDRLGPSSDSLSEGFRRAVEGDDGPLLEAAGESPGLVVEWGFPVQALPLVEAMIRRGYKAWYFEGDRDAALTAWTSNWASVQPKENWWAQVAGLDSVLPRIRAIYVNRIIRTVEAGPTHLAEPDIHKLMGPPGLMDRSREHVNRRSPTRRGLPHA